MDVSIRPYRPADADLLSELMYRSVHEGAAAFYRHEQRAAWLPRPLGAAEMARRAGDGRVVLVAETADATIVGYADLEPDGHLDHLYCSPDVLGRGVGSRLYDALERRARAAGLRRLRVEASEGARPLFERKGFTLEEQRVQRLNGVLIQNYAMSKDLAGTGTSLRRAWEARAEQWIAWATAPGHDHFFVELNLPSFLEVLPEPGSMTVEVGSGEGRLARALRERGHRVVGVETSWRLAAAGTRSRPPVNALCADGAALPIGAASADLVIAFMSLQDLDDLDGAFGEAFRVLVPGGAFCLAFLHPAATADDAYFEERRFSEVVERDGLSMEFHSVHRPLERYVDTLAGAGFVIELLKEPRVSATYLRRHPADAVLERRPPLVHLRARKPRIPGAVAQGASPGC